MSDSMNTELKKLSRFTRRDHTADEVYLFDVVLCDNEIDRDGERFSLDALAALAKLFVGVTGIFDHEAKSSGQTARIYETELCTDSTRKTRVGEAYTCLKGHAYMIRTEKNADLIREIDGGIKKEVSVSCTAAAQTCSICGANRRTAPCAHAHGKSYGGKVCHTVLGDITDAYEWSFVAVPAQPQAGVTKHLHTQDSDPELAQLRGAVAERDEVRKEISRLLHVSGAGAYRSILEHAAEQMQLPELIALRKAIQKDATPACSRQLAPFDDTPVAAFRCAAPPEVM